MTKVQNLKSNINHAHRDDVNFSLQNEFWMHALYFDEENYTRRNCMRKTCQKWGVDRRVVLQKMTTGGVCPFPSVLIHIQTIIFNIHEFLHSFM